MRLVDSNILIFAAKPEYPQLKELLQQDDIAVSDISLIEVLGFHKLTEEEEDFFSAVFSLVTIIPITDDIRDKAIELRRERNIKTADAVIAATALLYCTELITRDTDFNKIPDLTVNNPIAE